MTVKAVSYGGGVNSTAMLAGMVEREIRPDYILFADTGGERPETYDHLKTVDLWAMQHFDGIGITIVSNAGQYESLEDNCLKRHELPSLAYGFKGCSVKWKRQPMDRYMKSRPKALAAWAAGELVERWIGIDAGETRRKKLPPDDKWRYVYPLVEWGWDRDACLLAIKRAGLPQPPKSSCFFCPAMKKHEVRALAVEHPDLFARAVAIEQNSKAHTIKGLGRHWSWESLVAGAPVVASAPETPCDCMDEEDSDG